MTIQEALTRADALRPNKISRSEKLRWLSDLDGKIRHEIIDTHEGGPEEPFAGYTEQTSVQTELLAAAPYDDLYIKYLFAQIDLTNRELANYNNSVQVFDAAYTDYRNWYNRTHMSKEIRLRFFGRRHHYADPLSN